MTRPGAPYWSQDAVALSAALGSGAGGLSSDASSPRWRATRRLRSACDGRKPSCRLDFRAVRSARHLCRDVYRRRGVHVARPTHRRRTRPYRSGPPRSSDQGHGAEQGGRIVKGTGDGFYVVFRSRHVSMPRSRFKKRSRASIESIPTTRLHSRRARCGRAACRRWSRHCEHRLLFVELRQRRRVDAVGDCTNKGVCNLSDPNTPAARGTATRA